MLGNGASLWLSIQPGPAITGWQKGGEKMKKMAILLSLLFLVWGSQTLADEGKEFLNGDRNRLIEENELLMDAFVVVTSKATCSELKHVREKVEEGAKRLESGYLKAASSHIKVEEILDGCEKK